MLVKDVLKLCDKNMDICLDTMNGAADYIAENYLNLHNINDVKPYQLLNAHLENRELVDKNEKGSEKERILKEAQYIVRFSGVQNVNKFLDDVHNNLEVFGDLEVDYFDQNNQDQFVIHVKEI